MIILVGLFGGAVDTMSLGSFLAASAFFCAAFFAILPPSNL
jgi:hypothetical protein